MALDAELLDKFERDWNDAFANYEARTTATRLADTSVAPWARTQIAPEAAASLQSELLAPLQAKWDILREGARRTSSTPLIGDLEWGSPMNMGGGEAVRFNKFGGKEVLSPRRPQTGVTSTIESRRERDIYQSALRRLEDARRAGLRATTRKQRESADAEIAAAQQALDALNAPKIAPSNAAFENKFAQNPMEMMRPLPRGTIGSPGGPNAFNPSPFELEAPVAAPPVIEEEAAVGGRPFQMFGRGVQMTEGIDFSGVGPSVGRTVKILREKGK